MTIKAKEKNGLLPQEGMVAYIHAFQDAQKMYHQSHREGSQAIRRISHSLKTSPHSTATPEILRLLTRVEKAKGQDIEQRLQTLLNKLDEISAHLRQDYVPILLIDDDPIVAQVLQQQLGPFHRQLLIARSVQEAHAILAREEVSLIVLDLVLPDGDGRDYLVKLRADPATADLPVLVLSAKNEGPVQSECFALGADGYFEKPFDARALVTAIQAKIQRNLDAIRDSTMDAVTRLPNRQAFLRAFARARQLATRNAEPFAIAILDLDRFKSVNDVYGHAMGDTVLRKIAQLLKKTLRASDLIARWGGEEFAILFPDTDLPQAHHALEKALTTLRDSPFITPDGRKFRMTFSAGVTQVKQGSTAEKAIAEADHFLYVAKVAGRNLILSQADQTQSLKRNILLVEDDEFMAALVCGFLEKNGFQVFHVQNAASALSLCGEAVFSLITLDVNLPDMDGFDLLARIRKNPSTLRVPVIMLTSVSKEDDIVRGFKLGADDYIVKPFSPTQFLARVNRILEKQ
jgi:two-component system cell cycle response regulator